MPVSVDDLNLSGTRDEEGLEIVIAGMLTLSGIIRGCGCDDLMTYSMT